MAMNRRREFSKATRREAYERSKGMCECALVPSLPTFEKGCGCALGAGNTFYEHIDPDGAGGDNTLANCAVLVKTCWRIKTDEHDRPVVAKVQRQRDRAIGAKTNTFRPLPGSKRSGIKLPLGGRDVPHYRRTGEPVGGRR